MLKKKRKNKSVIVNQPIWRNSLQRISRNLPPEQQFRLPIFSLKVEGELFSLDTICEPLSSQSDTWCRMCIITLQWRRFITTFRVNWTLHRMSPIATVQKLCFYGQTGLFKVNIFSQLRNPRFTDFSLIKKIMYMREKGLPRKYSCLWTSQGEEEQG